MNGPVPMRKSMPKNFFAIGIAVVAVIAVAAYLAIGKPTAEATLAADPTNA